MDTRTGEIMDEGALRKKLGEEEFDQFAKRVNPQQLETPYRRELQENGKTKIGPNDKCPCGSGRKFKKCCMARPNNYEAKALEDE